MQFGVTTSWRDRLLSVTMPVIGLWLRAKSSTGARGGPTLLPGCNLIPSLARCVTLAERLSSKTARSMDGCSQRADVSALFSCNESAGRVGFSTPLDPRFKLSHQQLAERARVVSTNGRVK
jgi:hypothetical protein